MRRQVNSPPAARPPSKTQGLCPACQRRGALTPFRMTILPGSAVIVDYRCPECSHQWVERWLRDQAGRIIAVDRD